MKTTLLLLLAVATIGTGCTNTASIVKAMGESNAALSVDVQSPWGRVQVTRLNPDRNTPPYTVKDGAITVTEPAVRQSLKP